MPRGDRTGPMGMGPGTGREMGSCGAGNGRGWGRGYGRAMCGWLNRKYQTMNNDEKKELLKDEIEDLRQELKMAEEEMKELEK